MADVVDDVVATHHQHLREELPALGELVEKVRGVHGDTHPELAEVEGEFDALADLETDHEATAEHFERIADLTDDCAPPDDACPRYRSMLEPLDALERDTHMHVHKENNVLFPIVESALDGR